MNNERKQVLDMLAAGTITASEAERLMDRLEDGRGVETLVAEQPSGKLKYLRVLVESVDGDNVNIRVPLALVKAGMKLKTIIPDHARTKMEEKGVNLDAFSELDDEELMAALRELSVDVDSKEGDKVRIFCE